MSTFLCKIFLYRTSHLGLLRSPNVCSLRLFSSSGSDQEHSFTVSYLIDSLGLSPKEALSASKLVIFKTSEKPDNAIRFLEGYGFSKPQISTLVRRFPVILASNTDKTILPKLEFLKAKGISGPEMARMLSVFPGFLKCSLDKQIIPSFDFLRNLFGYEEKAVAAIKRYPNILGYSLKYAVHNIDILREHGVPDSNIVNLMHYQPRSFVVCSDRYRRVVEEVVEMGFDARQSNFVVAVFVSLAIGKTTWQNKVNAIKKWGLSDEEVSKIFLKNPWCMASSEDKITACMDFFVKEMGWSPSLIARSSKVLSLSLKKRTVPRCSVFRFLLSKGLVSDKVGLSALLLSTEDNFLKKFITPYQKKAPELLKLYNEKLSL